MIKQFVIGLVAMPFVLAFTLACLVGVGVVISFLAIGELGEAIERRLWK